MIIKIKYIILLVVLLSYTNLFLFKLGLAPVTLYYIFSIFFLYKFIRKIPNFFLMNLFYICTINFIFYTQIKLSSYLYTVFILIQILLLYNIINYLNKDIIIKILKIIIITYFINIIITFLFINISIKFLEKIKFLFQYFDFAGRIRPQGFSSEPSYAAIIISFCLFAILYQYNFKYKKILLFLTMSIIAILLTNSSYGIMCLCIIIIYTIYKNLSISSIIPIFIVLFFSILLLVSLDLPFESFNRLKNLFSLINQPDGLLNALNSVADVDGSASFRITPTIILIEEYWNKSNIHTILFGTGAGTASVFYSNYFNQVSDDIVLVNLGIIPSYLYNYGIVGFFIFIIFIYNLFPRNIVFYLLFTLVSFNADINTQIFLFLIFISYSLKKHSNEKIDYTHE